MSCCEVTLVPNGYSVTDTVHGDIDATRMPDNDRSETKTAVDEVGWLRSGDTLSS
ncbi:hypothetical protein SPRG_17306 [Saprolegnia parasitica CBS 223.65]|uniref:Uncharacterized protein n=1 Tax=Saprolegnia parasitica (strain CBS 223.65) TaxID=695850 RepID=A0A067BFW5_SAPPC|nr:hypothetical protein SPRG_17306 [Saprolegnia parasitica CBS 223.65]KDO17264.1 hypothetical protein SPRG_17306 [Saprolegnia parasitica CBS 223.65]|eukprot:XP_012212032.1 hypothetical protein SPRG_17306 [Saprolegnia parasitica CBS 223.65]